MATMAVAVSNDPYQFVVSWFGGWRRRGEDVRGKTKNLLVSSRTNPPGRDLRVVDAKTLGERFKRAVGCHQRGDLTSAARGYREILAQAPRHFDTLLYLGLIEAQHGNAVEGVNLMRRAVEVNPNAEAAHLNLGNVLLELGRAEESLQCFNRAVGINRRSPMALNSQGLALLEMQRNPEALAAFDRALLLQPDYVEALSNRGNALLQLGRAADALASYERALQIEPRSEQVLNNRGNALLELCRYADAVDSFNRALELQPAYAEALHHRGNAYWEMQNTTAALVDIEHALAINPAYAEAHNSLGTVLLKLERHAEALAAFESALALWPDFVEALSNRGNALLKLGREPEALASCERALQLNPLHPEALINCGNVWLWRGEAAHALDLYDIAIVHLQRKSSHAGSLAMALCNRGNTLMALNRPEEALKSYAESLAREDSPETHFYEGMGRLILGDFAQGWPQYEWRWKTQFFKRWVRDFSALRWQGQESLHGKTLLLHAEQGFGDTLQFCRYAVAAAAQGAAVVMEVQAPLKRLLATMPGVQLMVSAGEPLPPYDYHCPLLSMPGVMAKLSHDIPAAVPYIQPDPALVAAWRARIKGNQLPRIGLVWSGNLAPGLHHDRTLPLVDMLRVVSDRAQFFSLQKEVIASDKAELQRCDVRNYGEILNDFADTAAIIESMDLVITIDTAVAHLAGALGKPVWILLRFAADWRWLRNRDDSPWYPTARLFRQPAVGDWATVMDAVQRELPAFLKAVVRPET